MTANFVWDEKYSVQVPQIDTQHKMFFEIANEIVNSINAKTADKEMLISLIGRLIGYSFYHLNFEEYYFEKYKYEDRFTHKDEHDSFRVSVQKYKDASEKAEADIKEVASELADFSTQWLKQHILVVDAKYTDFFNNCPVEEY